MSGSRSPAERLYCSVCGEARGSEVYTCRKGGESVPWTQEDLTSEEDARRAVHSVAKGRELQELADRVGPGAGPSEEGWASQEFVGACDEGSRRAVQCPGCWSVNVAAVPPGGLECECGEKLTVIDLRASSLASGKAENERLREALDEACQRIAELLSAFGHRPEGEDVVITEVTRECAYNVAATDLPEFLRAQGKDDEATRTETVFPPNLELPAAAADRAALGEQS